MKSEQDLVNLFIEYIEDKGRTSVIITEVDTEFGRPDILEIIIDEKIIEKRRKNLKYELFNKDMQFSMAYLYGKSWVKIESLINFLKVDIKEGNRLISNLLDSKLVSIKDKYIKSYPYKELLAVKRIISYEAKLDNWKVAINQANRNKWFTNESYIVLDSKSASLKEKIVEVCKEAEIGLIISNGNGKFKNYNNIKKSKITNTPFIWKLNEEIIKGEGIWKRI